MSLDSLCVPPPPGRIPTDVSGRPIKKSPSDMTLKSQPKENSHPPPAVFPLIPATTIASKSLSLKSIL